MKPHDDSRIKRRACTLAPLVSVVVFLAVLALIDQGCRLRDADCNPASFLVLPVVAVVAGLPLMMVAAALILLPLWRRQTRRGPPRIAAFVILGLLPAALLSGGLLAFLDAPRPVVPAMLGFIAIGLGVPCLAGTLTFYHIMRGATAGR